MVKFVSILFLAVSGETCTKSCQKAIYVDLSGWDNEYKCGDTELCSGYTDCSLTEKTITCTGSGGSVNNQGSWNSRAPTRAPRRCECKGNCYPSKNRAPKRFCVVDENSTCSDVGRTSTHKKIAYDACSAARGVLRGAPRQRGSRAPRVCECRTGSKCEKSIRKKDTQGIPLHYCKVDKPTSCSDTIEQRSGSTNAYGDDVCPRRTSSKDLFALFRKNNRGNGSGSRSAIGSQRDFWAGKDNIITSQRHFGANSKNEINI